MNYLFNSGYRHIPTDVWLDFIILMLLSRNAEQIERRD